MGAFIVRGWGGVFLIKGNGLDGFLVTICHASRRRPHVGRSANSSAGLHPNKNTRLGAPRVDAQSKVIIHTITNRTNYTYRSVYDCVCIFIYEYKMSRFLTE